MKPPFVPLALLHLVLLAGCGGDGRETVTVPDVKGLSLEAAEGRLLEAGVEHGDFRCMIPPDFAVIDQFPETGTEVDPGTKVALLLEERHAIGAEAPAGGWPRCGSVGLG